MKDRPSRIRLLAPSFDPELPFRVGAAEQRRSADGDLSDEEIVAIATALFQLTGTATSDDTLTPWQSAGRSRELSHRT